MPCADAAPDAVAMPARRAPAGSSAAACRAAHSRRPTASDDAASPRRSRHPCGLRGRRSLRPSRCAARGCGRARARAIATSRSVERSAAISSRQTGCDDGSPSTRRPKPLAQPVLVLGMKGGAAARVPEDREHALVVLDQQVAGRRAHEHLDAGSARQALQLADVAGILARAADPEGEVAMHAVRAAPDLVGKRSRRWWSADWCWASRRRR